MVLAADYPFLDFLWSMLLVFLWIAWFFILFRVIIDIFRRHELSSFGKVAWLIFVILLPFLGVFVYIIVEGRQHGRARRCQAEASQQQFDTYVKSVASSGGAAAEIERAKSLLDSGAITQEEFDALKQKALAAG